MNKQNRFSGITRRSLLKNAAVATASSLLAGHGSLDFATPAWAASPNLQPVPSNPIAAASVTVAGRAVGSIPAGFAGLSYEKEKILGSLFTGSNETLIGVFKLLGPSVLRLGGSSVDRSVWTPNGTGYRQGHVSPTDIDNLAYFLKATNWNCIYGINLGGAATGATNPSKAAAEAAYVAERLGDSLVGIEIGNEPDFYGKAGGPFDGHWSFDEFLALWNEYQSAIIRAAPGVPVTGPATGSMPTAWTIPFGEIVTREKVNLLTQHHYRGFANLSSSTVEELLSPDSRIVSNLADLNAFSNRSKIPFRIAECNSYNGKFVGEPISGSYTTALWGLDFLFTCALGGASGLNFHGGGDSPGYSPIFNDASSVKSVRPLYYGMLLFSMAGTGTLLDTQVSAGSLNVTGYAVETASGGTSLVIINKDSSTNLEVDILLPQTAQTASLVTMTQLSTGADSPNLMATSGVTIQGAPVRTSGAFHPKAAYDLPAGSSRIKCYVPLLSAVLIQTV